jgi:TRAP-type C4-dicarboxylate transport system substrate-binding protein
LIVLVVLSAAGCGGDAPDGPIELVFGHVSAPGSLFAESAEEFARRANARLGDRATVVVYGSSQLRTDEVPDAEAAARHGRLCVAVIDLVVDDPGVRPVHRGIPN